MLVERRMRLVFAATLLFSTLAQARPYPLSFLPSDKLRALAPTLRASSLALIESKEDGKLKQLTTVAYVAAPPEAVREVVIHPEKYGEFVRNMKLSQVSYDADQAMLHTYAFSYVIHTVEGRHKYSLLPVEPSSPAAPVMMFDPDPEGWRTYHWEFLPAEGGGTVLVVYGYPFIPPDPFLDRFIARASTLEHGLGLACQMILMLTMKTRAEELQGTPPPPPAGKAGGFEFLLPRGAVALFRSSNGRLSDISLVQRSTARADVLIKVAGQPAKWAGILPSISESHATHERGEGSVVVIEQSLPLMTWTTTFAYRADDRSADQVGIGGELLGGRMRWDVRARSGGESEITLRAISPYDKSSLVLRQLYKLEPYFEHGVTVGLNLVLLNGVMREAERQTQRQATRQTATR